MPKQPRTEGELKKISLRLIIVLAIVIYLFTPGGHSAFIGFFDDVGRLFTHH